MKSRLPTERSFGVSVGLVGLAAGSLMWWRGYTPAAMVLAAIGIILVGGGLLAPAALRVPNRLWWRFAQGLGWINARILLALFFVVVLTPIGCLRRTFGRNPLRATQEGTNWIAYATRRRDPKHYEHQF